MGTKFTVYDSGSNPGKTVGALMEDSPARQELAAVCYVSKQDVLSTCSPSVEGPACQTLPLPVGNERAGFQRTAEDDRHHPGHEHEL